MHVSWVVGRLRICLLLGGLTVGAVAPRNAHATTPAGGDIAGSIRDSTNGTPLPNAEIGVKQGGQIVANASADQFGRFVVHGVPGGRYVVEVRLIGYKPDSQTVSVTEGSRAP